MMTYKQHYVLYLITIAIAIFILLGFFKFITDFSLENFQFLSIRNLVGMSLFYLAYRIYINQVDYY